LLYYYSNSAGVRYPLDPSQIPDPTTQAGQALFQRIPLFDPGYAYGLRTRGPSWLPALFDNSTGSATAAVRSHRAQLLAEAIPALSWVVGSQPGDKFSSLGNTFDMPMTYVNLNATWPLGNATNTSPNWRYSSIREVAYLYM
jgi:hypothetical protein